MEKVIVVREEHLTKAIQDMEWGRPRNQNCVLAHAAKEVLSDFHSCSAHVVTTKQGSKNMTLFYPARGDEGMMDLVNTFDSEDYEAVAKMLPLTIKIQVRPAE